MRTKEYAPEAALFPTSTDRHEPIKVKPRLPRRDFLSLLGATAAAALTSSFSASALAAAQTSAPESHTPRLKSPFRVSVINDEISQDFGRACEVASREFGMEWIELRGMWKKNIINLDASEIAETQRILKKYQLRVTDIASPLFKVDWPGAPRSKYSTSDDFHADFTFAQQDEVLDRAIELAKNFRTDRVRCFDFWRLDDPAPHRAAINAKLLEAAGKAGKTRNHPASGKRRRPQYRDRSGGRQGSEGGEVSIPDAELGSGQRRCRGRNTVSRRLQSAAQRPYRPLPLQGCGSARQGRLGGNGKRSRGLGRPVRGIQARWLSLCRQSRNPLGRRRHARKIHAPELGRNERVVAKGRDALVAGSSSNQQRSFRFYRSRRISWQTTRGETL